MRLSPIQVRDLVEGKRETLLFDLDLKCVLCVRTSGVHGVRFEDCCTIFLGEESKQSGI